jgi:hypothetical protein
VSGRRGPGTRPIVRRRLVCRHEKSCSSIGIGRSPASAQHRLVGDHSSATVPALASSDQSAAGGRPRVDHAPVPAPAAGTSNASIGPGGRLGFGLAHRPLRNVESLMRGRLAAIDSPVPKSTAPSIDAATARRPAQSSQWLSRPSTRSFHSSTVRPRPSVLHAVLAGQVLGQQIGAARACARRATGPRVAHRHREPRVHEALPEVRVEDDVPHRALAGHVGHAPVEPDALAALALVLAERDARAPT